MSATLIYSPPSVTELATGARLLKYGKMRVLTFENYMVESLSNGSVIITLPDGEKPISSVVCYLANTLCGIDTTGKLKWFGSTETNKKIHGSVTFIVQ